MSADLAVDLASLGTLLRLVSNAGEQDIEPLRRELDGWQATRLAGGRNNLLYKLERSGCSLVAKFTIRDDRDRAGREFYGLSALAGAGVAIAPRPVLLDRDSYAQPLVVQAWLDGEPLCRPPEADDDWGRLAELLGLCHSLRPCHQSVALRPAVLSAHSPAEALQIVRNELARMPGSERPVDVERFAERLERLSFRDWPEPPLTFVRCDPNIANVFKRPGVWACVDWEYSGWGDPAYDVAEMIMHPSYHDVPEERWEWFCGRVLDGDPNALGRVTAYRKTMNVWWLGRLARLRYETVRGLDRRLAPPNPGWEAELAQNYEHYLRLAEHI